MEEKSPLIFNIHHFALDDGPGIRTTVFLKGCSLSCTWCHNPESMSPYREIAFYPSLCIQCGDCGKVCPENAIEMTNAKRIIRDRCTSCGKCADICPSTALAVIGRHYSVDELVETLMKDRLFYETSNGGVTFSGGEPAIHTEYLKAVMKELKKNNIHIAVQTAGMFDLTEFRTKLLPYIDLIYYDLKIIDPVEHKKYTGADNRQILDNFAGLVKKCSKMIIPRMPLVPGITSTEDNLAKTAAFVRDAGCSTYELLSFNSGGIAKRHYLGKAVPGDVSDIRINMDNEKEYKELFSKHFSNTAGSDKKIIA